MQLIITEYLQAMELSVFQEHLLLIYLLLQAAVQAAEELTAVFGKLAAVAEQVEL
jgi:hypothetical protein